ncbi:CYTH domain-containing protein [Paenibacillus yanchengensis]|uniref:CYTH domain-containing protein n=1 Tax=Paenibacillus yanchengensis TaxID=2035833 RepID=A0ABW4YGR4_9BACL
MALEIERKYLLQQSLDELLQNNQIKIISEVIIEQTYLAIDEHQEIRVRKITSLGEQTTSYTQTFKKGNGLVREEVEYEISDAIYEQLVKPFGYIPLTKKRITAHALDKTVEIDVYDQLQMTVLEVEFDSVEAAQSFVEPDWFGQDISDAWQYSNKQVWKQLQLPRP